MEKAVKKVRVECSELALGMFVCELDRPWLESPFLVQGFYINDPDEIDQLREVCEFVYVDKRMERTKETQAQKGTAASGSDSAKILTLHVEDSGRAKSNTARKPVKARPKAPARTLNEQGVADYFPKKKLTRYAESVSWNKESGNAKIAIGSLYEKISELLGNSLKVGQKLEFDDTKTAVAAMVESVVSNPDACQWAMVTKPPGDINFDAAMRCSVLSVVLGRRIGLPKKDLRSLGLGGLLLDIGKLRLTDDILHADRKLEAAEIEKIRRHVEVGLNMLERKGMTEADVIECVAYHHERLDGSGYPNGYQGDEIPVFGRIAGLVDCYNAITGNRRYADSQSPAEAINELYKLKGVHFHSELVDEFIQAIGAYPVGALVQLSTGDVAVSIAQSPTRRLRPVVLKLLDKNKRPLARPEKVELENVTHTEDGARLDIVKNLPPKFLGIDLASLKI